MKFDEKIKSILEGSNFEYKTEVAYQYLLDNDKKFGKLLDKYSIGDVSELAAISELLIMLGDQFKDSESYTDGDFDKFLDKYQVENFTQSDLVEYEEGTNGEFLYDISDEGADFLKTLKKYLTKAIKDNKEFAHIKSDYYYKNL